MAIVAILAVVGVAVALLVAGGGDDDDDTASRGSSGSGSSSATTSATTADGGGDGGGEVGRPVAPPTGDAQFDDLAQSCYQGDMQACDDLYLQTPVGSEYEDYGNTCGGRLPDPRGRYCVDVVTDPLPPE